MSGILKESDFPGGAGVEAMVGVALPPEADWTPAPSPPDPRDTAVIEPNLTSNANTHLDKNSTNFSPASMVVAWVCIGEIIIWRGICN